jgi:hypothetical protein
LLPELTASIKIGLGILAASAALVTGLLGNVLAANISAFFSGTAPKTGKRPAVLWIAFAVFATLYIVAGSLATFAPVAAKPPERQPKVVLTNIDGQLLHSDSQSLLVICRDTLQMANTSDVTTSVVAVGTQIKMDGNLVVFDPTANESSQSNAQMRVAVLSWKVAPVIPDFSKIQTVDQFLTFQGVALPVRVQARSTAEIVIDYAMRFAKRMPQSVTAMHVLRFPDIADIKTDWMKCQ